MKAVLFLSFAIFIINATRMNIFSKLVSLKEILDELREAKNWLMKEKLDSSTIELFLAAYEIDKKQFGTGIASIMTQLEELKNGEAAVSPRNRFGIPRKLFGSGQTEPIGLDDEIKSTLEAIIKDAEETFKFTQAEANRIMASWVAGKHNVDDQLLFDNFYYRITTGDLAQMNPQATKSSWTPGLDGKNDQMMQRYVSTDGAAPLQTKAVIGEQTLGSQSRFPRVTTAMHRSPLQQKEGRMATKLRFPTVMHDRIQRLK